MASTSACRLTRVEMVTMRAMPAACARAITASSSPAKSGKSRWQWRSINMRFANGFAVPNGKNQRSVAHVRCRHVGVLFLEARDLAREVLQDALSFRRAVADRQLGDGLGQRRNDFIHVHHVFFAAQRAI